MELIFILYLNSISNNWGFLREERLSFNLALSSDTEDEVEEEVTILTIITGRTVDADVSLLVQTNPAEKRRRKPMKKKKKPIIRCHLLPAGRLSWISISFDLVPS